MKYLALSGLLVAAIVLGLGVWLATRPVQPAMPETPAGNRQISGDPAALGREILQVSQLEKSLARIESRAFAQREEGHLIAFAKPRVIDPALLAAAAKKDGKAKPRHARVSLLYTGQGFNRAVVDGKYVRQGDRLPNGGRVLNISENSVLIRSGHKRHRLHVPDARRIAHARSHRVGP